MKAVILAGGLGTRLSEETVSRPKPMVEIGGRPIIWHIMKLYSHYGINDFVICVGYKGYLIKEFFANYALHMADVTIDMVEHSLVFQARRAEPWRVTLADTGADTMTGGRIKRIADYVAGEEAFCMTYGDGLGDVDISASIAAHKSAGTLATLTAVRPTARFGALELDGGLVKSFHEKPLSEGGLINGGYFVLSPKVLDLIEGDHTMWEREPLEQLTQQGQLNAFVHEGFWQPMDTLREKNMLEELWSSGNAPWKLWPQSETA